MILRGLREFKKLDLVQIAQVRALPIEGLPFALEDVVRGYVQGVYDKKFQKVDNAEKASKIKPRGVLLKNIDQEENAEARIRKLLQPSHSDTTTSNTSRASETTKTSTDNDSSDESDDHSEEDEIVVGRKRVERELALPGNVVQPPGTILANERGKPFGMYFLTNKELRFVRYYTFLNLPRAVVDEMLKQLFENPQAHPLKAIFYLRLVKRQNQLKKTEEIFRRRRERLTWGRGRRSPPKSKDWEPWPRRQ